MQIRFEVLLMKAGSCDAVGGALSSLADGRLVGDGFVVDNIVKGESIQEVLSHANNQVSQPFSYQTNIISKC